jgi:hypothetical protein
MSELELFLKTSHSDRSGHIEGDIIQNHEQKNKWKKVKNQDLMQNKLFFENPALQPLAVSATWLHVGAPQKIQEKWA